LKLRVRQKLRVGQYWRCVPESSTVLAMFMTHMIDWPVACG